MSLDYNRKKNTKFESYVDFILIYKIVHAQYIMHFIDTDLV